MSMKRTKLSAACACVLAIAIMSTLKAGANDSSHVAHRPHPSNVLEGYAHGHVVALTYVAMHCTVDPFDDLDGPGHEGDGSPAAEDPDELLNPPCIFGATRSGSMPKVDPDGRDAQLAPILYGLLPNFDADGDGVTEDNDPTPAIESNCPQPGPPVSRRIGMPQTCAMHPMLYHAEPALRDLASATTGVDMPVDVPEGGLMNGHHSHVLSEMYSPKRWWLVRAVNVDDRTIWPDANGSCPATRGCLTSIDAIRAGQRAGKVEPDITSNVWFLFSVKPVA